MRLRPTIARAPEGAGAGAGAGGAAAQADGAAGQAAETRSQPNASWRDSLPDDLRGSPVLANFKSPAELAKEHINLQGLIGRKGHIPPADTAPDAEWDAFHGAIGRPETADKYDFKGIDIPPDVPWNDAATKRFMATAHKAGLTNRQARAYFAAHLEGQREIWASHTAGQKDRRTAAQTALRREWGAKFDDRVARANAIVRHFAGSHAGDLDGLTLSDGTKLLDHPILARVFAAVGESFGEGGALPGNPLDLGPGGAQGEIDRIRREAANDPKHPYVDKTHPEHAKVQQRMTWLYGQLAAQKGGA